MTKKLYLNELTKETTNTEPLDMNANRLKTEEQKIKWLENEIKDLEYVLSSDCINRNLKLNQLQMYREFLAVKRANYLKNAQVPVTKDKDQVKQAFTELYETSIKSTVDESLAKIETAWVTALDKFCQQMD